MSTSEKTLNQVRAILSKLDRSIDEAREKRTQPPVPAAPAPIAAAPQPTPPARAIQGPPPSQYGRAQPLARPQTNNQLRWNS